MTAAADTTLPKLALPHRFGASYLLFDRIGVGGMAEIFLARGKTRVGATRLAVVKLVLPALANDPRFASMLVAEAKLAAQLSHANIVQTYDLGREEGRLYIAMEYVEGFDLNELLRRCSRAKIPLPFEFALLIAGEVLRALDYAHRAKDADGRPLGIVHRDVSPSNVLISFEGEIKLCDFGIARAVNNSASDLSAETIEGKAAYMSPEQARGEPLDGRSDVFAASIVLWELLAGRRLYKPAPGQDPLALARDAEVPPLPDHGLPHHDKLAAIVAKGLAPAREDRYPTALAMLRELDGYVRVAGLHTSPLRLGSFLTDGFGLEIIESRRARERAAMALEQGPLVSIDVLSTPAGGVDEPSGSPASTESGGSSPSQPDHSVVRVRVPSGDALPVDPALAMAPSATSEAPSVPVTGAIDDAPTPVDAAAEVLAAQDAAGAAAPGGSTSAAVVPVPPASSSAVVAPQPARGRGVGPVAIVVGLLIALIAAVAGFLLGHR